MGNKFHSYSQLTNYFNNSSTQAIKLGLDRMKQFLSKINNPHNNLNCVHIAGTNGKGSVLKYIETILVESGYTVGSFISPHLIEYTERFSINGLPISQEDFLYYVNYIYHLVDYFNEEPLTLFELLTILSFLYFNDKKVDIAIFEVGMGGRLDATNVINRPLASIITNIDYDHTKHLGNTLHEIATEKAGILKENSYFVVNKNNKAIDTLINLAYEKNADSVIVNPDNYYFLRNTDTQEAYDLDNNFLYSISMQGTHQQENSLLAYYAIKVLRRSDFNIPDNAIRKGFLKTFWPGRAQYFSNDNILIDGAHNPDGAKCLRKLVDECYSNCKLIWIIGILETKDSLGILKTLISPADTVIITQPNANNATRIEYLRDLIIQNNLTKRVSVTKNLQEALKKVSSIKTEDTLIVLSGSLYLVGEYLSIKSAGVYG